MDSPSRRQFFVASLAIPFVPPLRSAADPSIRTVEVKTISHQPDLYCGWPTVTRRKSGELILVYSGGREAHVCPFGRVEMMRSHDDGKTWTWPEVILDGPLDDRDAGVVETSQGTLLVTTFTSLAYEPGLSQAEKIAPGDPKAWPAEKLTRWKAARDRLTATDRKQELGTWMIRSTNDGKSWSERFDCLLNSPHGPISLRDGTLLYAGKELWKPQQRNGVAVSKDDGKTWTWLSEIPTRKGDDAKQYHELHAVECASGKILVQIRNHNKSNAGETLQCESTDGGKTWTEPKAIGVWGLPSHLLKLKNGDLLMSYGHRRKPFGVQARISRNEGKSWSEVILISDDGITGDLGYPSTVELNDGTRLTIWYEVMKGNKNALLRQAKWKQV